VASFPRKPVLPAPVPQAQVSQSKGAGIRGDRAPAFGYAPGFRVSRCPPGMTYLRLFLIFIVSDC